MNNLYINEEGYLCTLQSVMDSKTGLSFLKATKYKVNTDGLFEEIPNQ